MYLVRTPELVKPFFKELIWSIPQSGNTVYLTFDDGPIPEITPWVLDQLRKFNAHATFFCLGRNAAGQSEMLQRIRNEGHTIGNHTWDHPNGWETPLFSYLRSVQRCHSVTGSDLFRPPYGRITAEQTRAIKRRYRIVMWEVLSADFDQSIGPETCIANVLDNVRPGSIVVFHDSVKAWDRLREALPVILAELRERGVAMKALV